MRHEVGGRSQVMRHQRLRDPHLGEHLVALSAVCMGVVVRHEDNRSVLHLATFLDREAIELVTL